MPVEVRMTVGHPLVYTGDSASKTEDGDLDIINGSRVVGSVKDGAWVSWEAYEEVDDDDDDEPKAIMGPDLDDSSAEHISPI